MMNWDEIEKDWKQMKAAVKEHWGKLTDQDLTAARGKAEAFAARLQERYGITREEAARQMEEFARAHQFHAG